MDNTNSGNAPLIDDDILNPDNTGTVQHTGFGPVASQVEDTSGAVNEAGLTAEEQAYADDTPDEESGTPVQATEDGSEEANLPPSNHNMGASPEEMFRDFMKDIGKYGKASGEGASALGRLGLRTLRAAADGIVSTAKPSQKGAKTDAVRIYEAYAAADSKHAEHTNGGMKANAAKLNAIIGMGVMTTCDPVAVGDRAVRIREDMEAAELKPKALFAGLVDVARAQQASDVELSDSAIREALTKTPSEKTVEKEWTAIQKKVNALITGEGSAGLKDQSETALKIGELVDERLKQFAVNDEHDAMVKLLVAKGYTEAMADDIASGRAK